jgi:threonine dehydratase
MSASGQAMPGIEDVRLAAERLRGLIVDTKLIESPALNEKFNARILFKPETLQRTGSFKFRGAYNKISLLSAEERSRGVVAFSSGNHAQGVAASAALFGVGAVIAMPSDAPAIKIENVRKMGAEVIFFDRFGDDRMTVVSPFIKDRGMALVPPFDDPAIIAGQGTIGLELIAEAEELGVELDAVVVPCGGGGLSSGISIAVKAASPKTEVWIAEPENFDDTKRSLASGERLSNEPGHHSICDAILSMEPGALTFAINRDTLSGGVAVPDHATAKAMRDAAAYLKLVVEPGGAVALAALDSGEIDLAGKCVVVVLSGGNADLEKYAEIITSC